MIKRILSVALLSAVVISNTGCGGKGDFKTVHGISYKIIKDAPGKTAKMGDIVEYHLFVKVDTLPGKSLILADSRKQNNGQPQPDRVDTIRMVGDYRAVFPFMSAGDSALVEVSCDTILKTVPPNQMGNLPPWLKKGNKVVITVAMVGIKSMEEFQKEMSEKQSKMMAEMKEKAEAQKPIDDKILQDYFAKNNVKPAKTESGLYYTIEKPGNGANVAKGQMVSIKYTGKTLDGKAFDSNVDTSVGHHGTAPLTWSAGSGQMIPGMDEGIQLLKKGAKATLYLPSPLAYGAQSPSPNIGPNSILMFDVEVLDVKAAAAPAAEAQPMPKQ